MQGDRQAGRQFTLSCSSSPTWPAPDHAPRDILLLLLLPALPRLLCCCCPHPLHMLLLPPPPPLHMHPACPPQASMSCHPHVLMQPFPPPLPPPPLPFPPPRCHCSCRQHVHPPHTPPPAARAVPWDVYRFLDFDYPAHLTPKAESPTGAEVHAYIKAYAAHFQLDHLVQLRCKLLQVKQAGAGACWTGVSRGASGRSSRRARGPAGQG